MGIFGRRRKAEARGAVSLSGEAQNFLRIIGLEAMGGTQSGVAVTVSKALGVPAIWSAVNFLSGTFAGLPLHHYRRGDGGRRERVRNSNIERVAARVANPTMSAFAWRKYGMERVLTTGRSISFIERNGRDEVMNIWPLNPEKVTIRESGSGGSHVKTYEIDDAGKKHRYDAQEIIDVPFMLASDGLAHLGPIATNAEVIGMAIAATTYGARYFNNGGVPPFVITGRFESAGAMQRASDDLEAAVRKAARENRQALALPEGLDVKPIGGNAEDNQMVETQKFMVEQIARIYGLPPIFLQDLSHGTYSNTEQQDLHFVKHVLRRWVEQWEEELNLKIFGRESDDYLEFNLDGVLRGDFRTRMEGHARAIQSGIETPNEAREMENRPALPGGDDLMIQAATVPLKTQGDAGGGTGNNGGGND